MGNRTRYIVLVNAFENPVQFRNPFFCPFQILFAPLHFLFPFVKTLLPYHFQKGCDVVKEQISHIEYPAQYKLFQRFLADKVR